MARLDATLSKLEIAVSVKPRRKCQSRLATKMVRLREGPTLRGKKAKSQYLTGRARKSDNGMADVSS
jgi:hypothetical protein